MRAVIWMVVVLAWLALGCGGRDNSGYRGPIPGSARAQAVTATQTAVPVTPPPFARTDPTAGIPPLSGPTETTASGLQYIDERVGTGPSPQTGQSVNVHYTGWLTDGTKFDSSVDRGQVFSFQIGRGNVIRGWDEGVASMKVGGKRRLIIPPDLGYGSRGSAGSIPPDATLIFDVELISIS